MANYKLKAEGGQYEYEGGPVTFKHTLEYIKKDPLLFGLLLVLTFGGPFIGFVATDWVGVGIGLVNAIICWYLSHRAVKTVIEHRITN
jgi:hypothetical protein